MRTAHVHSAHLSPAQQAWVEVDGPWARTCRDVWNAALDERLGALTAARERKMPVGWWPTHASQCRGLTEAKKVAPWLAEAPHHVLQQTLKDLDAAWAAWLYERRAGRPRFRAKKRQARNWWAPSYRFPDRNQFTIERTSKRWGRARLPKVGMVKFRWDRGLPDGGIITNTTLKRDRVGDWIIVFAIDAPDVEVAHPQPRSAVGIDRGVVSLAVTSDGQSFDREAIGGALGPDLLTGGERGRLKRLQHNKSRQQRGSANTARTRRQIAKLKRRQTRRRADLAHKVSHQLARDFETVAVEDLNVRQMMKSARGTAEAPAAGVSQKRGLNRAIAGKGWGMLKAHLAYKTTRVGGHLVEVDPRNTSRTCHVCSTVDASSRENQARFACTACGHVCHADVNAAINILARATLTGQGCEGSDGGRPLAACGASALVGSAKQEPAGSPSRVAA